MRHPPGGSSQDPLAPASRSYLVKWKPLRKLTMGQRLVPLSVVALLLAGALMLPVAISILFGLGALLAAMGDSAGGTALGWIALVLGVFWVLDLVCLILVQAINSLGHEDRQKHQGQEDQ